VRKRSSLGCLLLPTFSSRIHSPGYFLHSQKTNYSKDTDKPISCGFYRLEAGKELVYPYTYDEMKIILEGSTSLNLISNSGEFTITDETGYSVTAKPGDVFYFEKGIFPEEERLRG